MTDLKYPYPYLPETDEEKRAGSFALRVQRNFEWIAKKMSTDGRVAFIKGAGRRVWGPTSIHPTVDDAYSLGFGSEATASFAVSIGNSTLASGASSFAEGLSTEATAEAAHAEGEATSASGEASHAEGESCSATAEAAHAEGLSTAASGADSHSEGHSTIASGPHSHAEGDSTTASGDASHAEGESSVAALYAEHAHSSTTRGQYSRVVLTKDTTNATTTELLIGGGDHIAVPSGETWTVTAEVAAHRTDVAGTVAGFSLAGLVSSSGGTLRLVGTTTVDSWADAAAATWLADLAVSGANLLVNVNGEAAKTVRWIATVHATRIG